MSVRALEVELTRLEDKILGDLGYREYVVQIGNSVLSPIPGVEQKDASAFPSAALSTFIDQMGGHGNPIGFYQLSVSRLIPESLIRSLEYWTLTRDGYVIQALPVALVVTDARYRVTLGVVKITSVAVEPPSTVYPTFDATALLTFDTIAFQFDSLPPSTP